MKNATSLFLAAWLIAQCFYAAAQNKCMIAFDTSYTEIKNPARDSVLFIVVRFTNKPPSSFVINISDRGLGYTPQQDFQILFPDDRYYVDTTIFRDMATVTRNIPVQIKHDTANTVSRIIEFYLQTDTANFIFTGPTYHLHIVKAPDEHKIDSADFQLGLGANFDFIDGVSPTNLAFDADLFLPDIFNLFTKKDNRRFGFDFGLYENRTIGTTDDKVFEKKFRTFRTDSTSKIEVFDERFSVKSVNEVRNLGAYGSLLIRLGEKSNTHFRSYFEFCYELIQRRVETTNTYSVIDSIITFNDSANVPSDFEQDIKPPKVLANFSDEYLSAGIMTYYQNGEMSYNGEILVGFFSSPFEGYNGQFLNNKNLFYNLTFRLCYKRSFCLGGEIRHLDFTTSRKPYIIVNLSKTFDLDRLFAFIKP